MKIVGYQIFAQCKRRGSSQREEANQCSNEFLMMGDIWAKVDGVENTMEEISAFQILR